MPDPHDPWRWRAEYADGSVLDEYDEDAPDGRGWAQVERLAEVRGTALARVLLIPQRPHLSTHVALPLRGARIVVSRRRPVTVSAVSGEEVGRRDPITIIHIIHVLYGADGADGDASERAAYTFLFADGSVVVSDELNAV